ncbi:MAG: 6-pyruvoyl tetrahydropterin synthase family protein [Methanomassiliicoccales archaeon]|nr:MAG: 6-pyruvoyl tetrahydropterin synthase family protein [Methanomassiliicoccales archaeon]
MLIAIDGWRTGVTFSASHFIPSHEGCERLHGHSFAIHVRVEGDKGPAGMVMDFVPLRKALKAMANSFDHKMLIAGRSDSVRREGDTVVYETRGKRFVFPREQTVELDIEFTTAEDIAEYIVHRLVEDLEFPENVRIVTIGVDEGGGQVAWVSRRL